LGGNISLGPDIFLWGYMGVRAERLTLSLVSARWAFPFQGFPRNSLKFLTHFVTRVGPNHFWGCVQQSKFTFSWGGSFCTQKIWGRRWETPVCL